MVLFRRDALIIYCIIVSIIVFSILFFEYYGLSREPMFFRWAILYFGSAVLQAYATIIAVPFTIWVIYMQSRYGYILVRLFINRVLYPFTILGIITIITAITMSLEETSYAYQAFLVEYIATLIFLPPIIFYIRDLMTMNPEKIVRLVEKISREKGEAIATSLHIVKLVLIEEYPEEKVINNILKTIRDELSDIHEIKLYPDTYHKFRDLLRTIVVEGTYLPDIRILRDLMKNMLQWVVINRKYSIARAFTRYYRMVAIRYLEETIPSLAIDYLYLDPVINNLRNMRARRSLIGYALDQLYTLVQKIRSLGQRGDITALEICFILNIIERETSDLNYVKEYEKLHRLLNEVRGEFLCITGEAVEETSSSQQ